MRQKHSRQVVGVTVETESRGLDTWSLVGKGVELKCCMSLWVLSVKLGDLGGSSANYSGCNERSQENLERNWEVGSEARV